MQEPKPRTLDYTSQRTPRCVDPRVVAGFCTVWVLAVTPLALCLGFATGRASDYLGRVLFPYSTLAARVLSGESIAPLVALTLAQMPLYGVAITLASFRGRRALLLTTLGLALARTLAAVAALVASR